jgi:hypothetical protein
MESSTDRECCLTIKISERASEQPGQIKNTQWSDIDGVQSCFDQRDSDAVTKLEVQSANALLFCCPPMYTVIEGVQAATE